MDTWQSIHLALLTVPIYIWDCGILGILTPSTPPGVSRWSSLSQSCGLTRKTPRPFLTMKGTRAYSPCLNRVMCGRETRNCWSHLPSWGKPDSKWCQNTRKDSVGGEGEQEHKSIPNNKRRVLMTLWPSGSNVTWSLPYLWPLNVTWLI